MVSQFLEETNATENVLQGFCCPECGAQLLPAKIELAGGVTLDGVQCANNCDLRPYTF